MKDYSDRIEPSVAEAAPTKTGQTAGKPVPREVNAHFRTLGVAQTATEEELKAARTKALYDNSLPDDEKLRIRNAYEQIAEYRDNPAAYEAKLATAAAQEKAATQPQKAAAKGNPFKIGPRSMAAVAVIAIGAALGTAKFMQSDENKAQNAVDNARTINTLQEKASSTFETIKNFLVKKPAEDPRKVSYQDNKLGRDINFAAQHFIDANSDKLFGKSSANKDILAASLKKQIIFHTGVATSQFNKVAKYETPVIKLDMKRNDDPDHRSVKLVYDLKRGELTFNILGQKDTPLTSVSMDLATAAKRKPAATAPAQK